MPDARLHAVCKSIDRLAAVHRDHKACGCKRRIGLRPLCSFYEQQHAHRPQYSQVRRCNAQSSHLYARMLLAPVVRIELP